MLTAGEGKNTQLSQLFQPKKQSKLVKHL